MRLRVYSLRLPFLGLFLGYMSYFFTVLLVTLGMPNKGILGTITFPVAEELIKFSLVLIFVKILNLSFSEALILGLITGVGFRFPEMGIKTKSALSFLLGASGHGVWTCVSLKGYYRYQDNGACRELLWIMMAVVFHFGFNLFAGGNLDTWRSFLGI
jgi:hypothetical protein